MKKSVIAASIATLGVIGAQAEPIVNLNTAGYYTYGNVNSYSMPLNGISIPSTPGAIKDQIVIYTGANGQGVTTNIAGIDDAYGVPNGSQTSYASIGENTGVVSPGNKAGIVNNGALTWDASLLSLKGFLNGSTALFLFNNNDTNKDQTLAIWAKFWLTNGSGSVYNNQYLYLSNHGAAYGAGGTPMGGAADWSTNYGNVTNPLTGYAATDYVLAGGVVNGVNHNLGADHVAYAGDAPLLDQWLSTLFQLDDAALGQYTFHLDLRMGCNGDAAWANCDSVKIDNGYEQLFLVANNKATTTTFDVPEPASMALVGLALTAMGVAGTRRQRKQDKAA